MEYEEVKKVVFGIAAELAGRGPGWAQEAIVLREAAARLRRQLGEDLSAQQAVLTAWHDLFLERKLSWGYNLDNPNSPFFHVPKSEDEATGAPSRTPVATK
jgi:hypothetical protein